MKPQIRVLWDLHVMIGSFTLYFGIGQIIRRERERKPHAHRSPK